MASGDVIVVSTDALSSVVRLTGEFDEVGALLEVLIELAARSRSVELDMAGVTYFGSRGLSALVAARAAAVAGGGSLHIVAASEPVERLLAVSELEELLRPTGSDNDRDSPHP